MQHTEEISTVASQAIAEVQAIPYNLRLYQLDRIGLTKAVEARIQTAARSSSIAFSSEIADIDAVFPKPPEINFYRIVQESVNNVLKHSEATKVDVAIQRDDGWLHLKVEDNGRGHNGESDATRAGSGDDGQSGDQIEDRRATACLKPSESSWPTITQL